jgi:hypothetical protein
VSRRAGHVGSFGPAEVLAGIGLTLPGITRLMLSPHAFCDASDHSSECCEALVRRVPIPPRVLFGVDPWTSLLTARPVTLANGDCAGVATGVTACTRPS